ncbi:phage repressor, partial [Lasius niger]
MNMNENTIGSRLALARGRLSQAEFAQIIGIHKNSIGNYERGDREIGAGALATYVTLGWNANWLLTGEGPERIEAASKEMPSHYASEAEPLNGIKLELFAIAVELVDREVPRFGKS